MIQTGVLNSAAWISWIGWWATMRMWIYLTYTDTNTNQNRMLGLERVHWRIVALYWSRSQCGCASSETLRPCSFCILREISRFGTASSWATSKILSWKLKTAFWRRNKWNGLDEFIEDVASSSGPMLLTYKFSAGACQNILLYTFSAIAFPAHALAAGAKEAFYFRALVL